MNLKWKIVESAKFNQQGNKINYLKEININFNKIKKLRLKFDIYNNDKDDNTAQNEIKNFFEILFSFDNIENNLINLYILIIL